MSNKATVYPDINSLLKRVEGQRTKLREQRIWRANYQTMLLMYKQEKGLAEGYKSWADNLQRVLEEFASDNDGVTLEMQEFAVKVLAARPKNVL